MATGTDDRKDAIKDSRDSRQNAKDTAKSRDGGGKGKGTGSGSSSKAGNYSDARDDPVAKENMARNADARNDGESWGDGFGGVVNEIGHALGGLIGLDEKEESFTETATDMARPDYAAPGPGTPANNHARWGFSPIQAMANFAGLATGAPIGTAVALGNAAAQHLGLGGLPEIDMGRNVLSADDAPSRPTALGGAPSQGSGNAGNQGGNDRGGTGGSGEKNNGLLPSDKPNKPSVFPVTPKPTPATPTTPPPATKPPTGPSKYPTPSQKFQAPSYFAGDWVFNPTTQKVEWVANAPSNNGLLTA